MRRFFYNSKGNVDQRIIVIAIIALIAVFSFVKIKEVAKCATLHSEKSIWTVLFDDATKEDCKQKINNDSDASGEKNGAGEDGGTTDSGSGSGGSGSGSSGDGTGGTSSGETGSDALTSSEDAVPISHYEQQGMDLTCSEKKSYYSFSIPMSAPPKSIGTQSITLKNNQGWDMWVKISEIVPENGLVITTDDNFYRTLADGEEVAFRVGWKWDVPSGYAGDKGDAKVYFEVSCKTPPSQELYTPDVTAPTNFRVTGKGDTKIDLAWDAVNYASEYYVYRNGSLVYKGSSQAYEDNNLLPGTTYNYKLYTSETTGTDVYASLQQTTTGISPIPPKPANMKVVGLTETSFHVMWDTSKNATHYRRFLDGKEIGDTVWRDSIITGLKPNTTYEYKVIAVNIYGESEISTINIKTNAPTSVSNPTNFRQVSRTERSQEIAWDPVPGATSYILTGWGTVYYQGPNTSFVHNNIGPGGAVHYFLYAVKGNEKSSGVYKSMGPLGVPYPTIPYNIHISNITNTSMKLSWTKGSSATTTKIKINGQEIYNDTGTSINITNMTPNTYYKFELSSVNSTGSSGITTISDFTTNETYDGISNLSATCSVENYTQKFVFPTGIKPGESGMFILNVTNTSNRNLYLQIGEVVRNGSLFDGSTPVKVEYDEGVTEIKPTQKFEVPIRWILPSNASSNYKGANGSIDVNVETSC